MMILSKKATTTASPTTTSDAVPRRSTGLATMTSAEVRDKLVEALVLDLIGPIDDPSP